MGHGRRVTGGLSVLGPACPVGRLRQHNLMRCLLALVCRLQSSDIDLAHPHHGLHHPA